MAELMYPNIYSIQIPLPNNPLKSLNSYIIVSEDRNLIIDTGFNQSECKEALFGGLHELSIDLAKTDVLLTHLHADHTGQAKALEDKGARIYAGTTESITIQEMADPHSWTRIKDLITKYGLEKYGILIENLPGYRYRPEKLSCCHPLAEGDQLRYGDYVFSVVDIPGHTPGHIGLYEPNQGLFFCGDHILNSITPNITLWNYGLDSLAQYLASLAKVRSMDIRRLFTAHREGVEDYKTRIDQLIGHHHKRLQEIMNILEQGDKSACEVASLMKWEIRAKSWEDFPIAQKSFATGEAASHLEYLFHGGQIHRTCTEGVMYYRLP